MVRLNLVLSDEDYGVLSRLAEENRMRVGTYARVLLVATALRAVRGEAGQPYPQESISFPGVHKSKQRGKK